jgi:hypothetical protein
MVSLLATLLSLHVSSLNYAGGHALHNFHLLYGKDGRPSDNAVTLPVLHLCNLAATTGASRFGQHDGLLRYSKQEGLSPEQLGLQGFDFLLVEAKDGSMAPPEVDGYTPMLPRVEGVPGARFDAGTPSPLVLAFYRLHFHPRTFPFLEVQQRPAIWIMQRDAVWTSNAQRHEATPG